MNVEIGSFSSKLRKWSLLLVGCSLLSMHLTGCKINNDIKAETLASNSETAAQSEKEKLPKTNWEFYGELRRKFQIEDELISSLISQPPRSAWNESEKKFYQEILNDKDYDILVVPFQTQDYGLDHIERMLMSYKLAVSIEQNSNFKVAPLHFVCPALGILQRYYNEDEVYSFAKEMGVSRIIWCYAGTQNETEDESLTLAFSIIDEKHPFAKENRKVNCEKWTDIISQPENLPFQVFDSTIEGVFEFLDIAFTEQPANDISASEMIFQLPDSPSELLSSANDNILLRSYYLQFLAMIAPTDYQKTYLYTRSISNLFQIKTNGPERKLIEARAFLHLYRRPAALKILEGLGTIEGAALQEYADANLPELEEKIELLEPSIKRTLAELEMYKLKDDYNNAISEKEIDGYAGKYPGWSYFLKKRLANYDSWEISSNVVLKQILDECLPVQDFSLDEILSGQMISVDGYDDIKLDLLFQDHIHKAMLTRMDSLADKTNTSGDIIELDFLSMAESVGIHNLIKMIKIPGFAQYIPEKGLQVCNNILMYYQDHPYFTCLKFTLLYNLIDGSSAVVKNNLRKEVYNLAINTMWWNGRQNWVNKSANKYLSYIAKYEDENIVHQTPYISEKNIENCIKMDYPFRINNIADSSVRSSESMLSWIHTEFSSLTTIFYRFFYGDLENNTNESKHNTAKWIVSEIERRFNGHPKKNSFIITQKLKEDKSVDKKDLLLAQIEQGDDVWKTYKELAKLYISEYSYDEAKEILLKYYKLKPSYEENNIAKSNLAAVSGDLFFERGAFDHATYFYKICDQLDTWSGLCLRGQERLALIKKNYAAAAEYSLACAKRYSDPSSYANYMTYLHLQGEHELAWSVFRTMLEEYDESSEIWTSAMIGNNIVGRSDEETISWLNEMSEIAGSGIQKKYIARFGCLSLMDRSSRKGMIDAIEAMEMSNLKNVPTGNKQDKLTFLNIAPLIPYTSFAKCYDLLLKGEYEDAYESLSKLVYYSADGYFAYAAAKTGRIEEYKLKYLPETPPVQNLKKGHFNNLIEFAVVYCYSGQHDDAVQSLKNAFSVRSSANDMPYDSMYYLAEICEWLYIDSQEPMYLELLLEWSGIFQQIVPMYAWPYSIEAKYSLNEEEKIKSLAIAQYLDPRSKRISEIDDEIKEKAKIWLKDNNPFIEKIGFNDGGKKLI